MSIYIYIYKGTHTHTHLCESLSLYLCTPANENWRCVHCISVMLLGCGGVVAHEGAGREENVFNGSI